MTIRPELSAQGIRKSINPMLPKVISVLRELADFEGQPPLIVDCGCGQLRNVECLSSLSPRIVLVDTPFQLDTPHVMLGTRMLIGDFVKKNLASLDANVMYTTDFEKSRLDAKVIFSINVLDVLPRATRVSMVRACIRNMATDGLFVAIVPRNDTWTLRICTPEAQYQDGYVFQHKRGYTYYHNWKGDTLAKWVDRQGLAIVEDISIYRHACLICRKKPNQGMQRTR